MIYVGIDPGLDGAIALIDIIRNETQAWDTPTLTVTKSSGSKREYNEGMMRTIVQGLLSRVPSAMHVECALEQIHSMPGQGVRSMFSMGQGYGLWRGLLSMAGVPYKLVAPQTWKKYHGLLGADKEASRLLALQSYPQLAPVLGRKKDHGRAEALLLADFARARRA
jgi:crossover junction endodeoxyribonuclease RuvC